MQSINDALALINASTDTDLANEIIRNLDEYERRGVIYALAKLTRAAYESTSTQPLEQWLQSVRQVAEDAN